MTATSQSKGDAFDERVAKAPGEQPEQLDDAHSCNETGTAARSEADVALARLLVEIRKVMFLPPTDPTRIAVMAEKRRVLALVEAYQTRAL